MTAQRQLSLRLAARRWPAVACRGLEEIDHFVWQHVSEEKPHSASSEFVRALVAARGAHVYTGEDEYAALCFLMSAHVLVVSTGSTFSQMAGMLARDAQVHYAVTELPPRITLLVPRWHYHRATASRLRCRER